MGTLLRATMRTARQNLEQRPRHYGGYTAKTASLPEDYTTKTASLHESCTTRTAPPKRPPLDEIRTRDPCAPRQRNPVSNDCIDKPKKLIPSTCCYRRMSSQSRPKGECLGIPKLSQLGQVQDHESRNKKWKPKPAQCVAPNRGRSSGGKKSKTPTMTSRRGCQTNPISKEIPAVGAALINDCTEATPKDFMSCC